MCPENISQRLSSFINKRPSSSPPPLHYHLRQEYGKLLDIDEKHGLDTRACEHFVRFIHGEVEAIVQGLQDADEREEFWRLVLRTIQHITSGEGSVRDLLEFLAMIQLYLRHSLEMFFISPEFGIEDLQLLNQENPYVEALRTFTLRSIFTMQGETNALRFVADAGFRENLPWLEKIPLLLRNTHPNVPRRDFGLLYGPRYIEIREALSNTFLSSRHVPVLSSLRQRSGDTAQFDKLLLLTAYQAVIRNAMAFHCHLLA